MIYAICERCGRTRSEAIDGKSANMFGTAKARLSAKLRRDKWVDRSMGYRKPQAYCGECADKAELTAKEAESQQVPTERNNDRTHQQREA
jgi:hypothetical protein